MFGQDGLVLLVLAVGASACPLQVLPERAMSRLRPLPGLIDDDAVPPPDLSWIRITSCECKEVVALHDMGQHLAR